MPTLAQLLAGAAQRLTAVSSTPRLEAEVLLAHAGGYSRTGLIARENDAADTDVERQFQALVDRRLGGEPIAHLTGMREFWSLELEVGPPTLIPRPETELLVERALARIPPDDCRRVADLGTGSGAIAIAVAKERPRCSIVATDVSEAALSVARRNARRHAVDNVAFLHGDWFTPLDTQRFDLLVSNPPYVCDNDPHLRQGDLRFEPRDALAAGTDGLDAIRIIVRLAPAHLTQGGWLLLEHGFDQGPQVVELMQQAGFTAVRTYQDLGGRDRVCEGKYEDRVTSN